MRSREDVSKGRGLALALGAAITVAAQAQDVPKDALLTPPSDRWTIRFEPSVFYAAPGGEMRLPGSANTFKFVDLDLEAPRASPYAELHVRSGDYRVTVSGFAVSLEEVGKVATGPNQIGPIAVNTGDLIESSFSLACGEAVFARQLGGPDAVNGLQNHDFALNFEALGGVRFYDVRLDARAPGGSTSADEFFITPIVGLKATMNIVDRFDIDLQVTTGVFSTGADRSVFCMEILNGYTYRPVPNVGLQVGYRLSYYDMQSGNGLARFEYSGAVAGLFAGVVIRF